MLHLELCNCRNLHISVVYFILNYPKFFWEELELYAQTFDFGAFFLKPVLNQF